MIKHRLVLILFLLFSGLIMMQSCNDTNGSPPVTGDWTRGIYYSGQPRSGSVSFVLNNKAYVGLGYNGRNDIYYQDFYAYDHSEKTWRKIQDFPGKARERSVSFTIGEYAYVGLGYNRNDTELRKGAKDFYKYDPATDTWTAISPFGGSARYNSVGFAINNMGYVGMGFDDQSYYRSDFYKYDPGSNAWSVSPDFPGGKRERGLAITTNNIAYIGTGINNGSFTSDFWSFDGSKWTSLTPDSDVDYYANFIEAVNRLDATGFAIKDKIYITCGISSSNNLVTTCFEYDLTTKMWSKKSNYEGAERSSPISFVIDDKAFVGTGQKASNYWDDMWQFDPDASPSASSN